MKHADDKGGGLAQAIFAGSTGTATKTEVSARLRRWCIGFENWCEHRRHSYHPITNRAGLRISRHFFEHCGKFPWQVTAADVEDYVEQLQEQGYALSTINYHLSTLASFYRWCSQNNVDRYCGSDFNPLAEFKRPSGELYQHAHLWSRAEADALLGILESDVWILSKRDAAFFTCRFLLGISNRDLRQLQWGQIEEQKATRWLNLGSAKERVRLEPRAWHSLEIYLRAAGRLSPQRTPPAEAYIFAPLVNMGYEIGGNQPQDWDENRCLQAITLRNSLQTYGKLVGIGAEKLRLPNLRHTAAAWRLEASDSSKQIDVFLGSPGILLTRNYIGHLRRMMRTRGEETFVAKVPAALPVRRQFKFQPGDRIQHGLYAQIQPSGELQEMLGLDVRGLDFEIEAMRCLERRLVVELAEKHPRKELIDLMDMSTRAAVWMARLIDSEKKLKAEGKGDEAFVEQFLDAMRQMAEKGGIPFDRERIFADALESDPGLAVSNRRLVEEIATTRLIMRRSLKLAMETADLSELVRWTGVYGETSARLCRLLKAQGNEVGRVAEHLWEVAQRAIKETVDELRRG
ncbi:MAG: phage integrase N-terminal SAM-like domain-containing protein [Anaerolineales bacterium]|nr:phage integrase N-terminal SAM-like domain-containing protein [Anaerolineales bacterium]